MGWRRVEWSELGSAVSGPASRPGVCTLVTKVLTMAGSPRMCWDGREPLPPTETLPLKLNSYRKNDASGAWGQLECTTKDSGKFLQSLNIW